MMVWILLIILAALFLRYVIQEIKFRQSTYYAMTKISRLRVLRDKGRYGEYLIWHTLRDMEETGARFLFNLYLPRDKGRTTEIDVLMLSQKGIFVFESKNYSGWIFGSEKSRFWTQTLPSGREAHKERFLNPIMQNGLHIRCLKKTIGHDVPIYSVVVFSNRCELKRLEVNMSGTVQVVKLNYLRSVVKNINWGESLTLQQVDELYNLLYPYSQVSETVKKAHIREIEEQLNGNPPSNTEEGEQPSISNTHSSSLSVAAVLPMSSTNSSGIDSSGEAVSSESRNEPKTATVPVCPLCGGKLVLRTAMRGPNTGTRFFGCSNYPRCRYTKNANT